MEVEVKFTQIWKFFQCYNVCEMNPRIYKLKPDPNAKNEIIFRLLFPNCNIDITAFR